MGLLETAKGPIFADRLDQYSNMKETLRVLLIEDSTDDAALVLHELRRGKFDLHAERVDTLSGLTAALDRDRWDIVICDHNLPGFDSSHALQIVTERQLNIPFIIVSGMMGEETAVKAMKAGAHDYVMKNNLARLAPAIERELREASSRKAMAEAEAALRRSERELNDFFEHAPVGLHFAGPDGVMLRVNQAELEMLGYGHEDYVGHAFAEFFADRGVSEKVQNILQSGGQLQNFEARLRCKNGTIKHVSINANTLKENGKFIHSRCFIRDITDRKLAEEALAYLAAIVESSEDAVIGLTMTGAILSWNAGAIRMYGYSSEEIVGCTASVLMPSYRPDELWAMLGRLRAGKQIERYETFRRRRDGTTLEVASTLSPIKDRVGNIIGISAIERDISTTRREEGERLQLITDLTEALAKIRNLHRFLPVCPSCKKIRNAQGDWQEIENPIPLQVDRDFNPGLCPDCLNIRPVDEATWQTLSVPASISTSGSGGVFAACKD